ncbi:MAG TPA: C45 family peptidase [Anaerolineae bacterium]|nr:C45 family peptidase [Anaerolineae bacterium]
MTLPVLHLSGTPYEQGAQQGAQLKERIAHNIDLYFERFEREGKLPRAEALARARQYAQAIADDNRDYFDALRGVADGSGFDFDQLAALNVRYEILYYQFTLNALGDGCTAFAVLPEASANGHLLLGQNWDWIPQVQGAVLHTLEPGGLETWSFTEAGIVGGKIGLNSAGLGLAINGLNTTGDDWSRLSKPFHVRCYEILRARNFDAAVQVVTGARRACSTNFLIAQTPERVVDVEAAPDAVRLLDCERGCLVHTNHFLDPDALGVVEPYAASTPRTTFHRLDRFRELLQVKRPLAIEDLQGYLRDHAGHPDSVCRHPHPAAPPHDRYRTVTSVVMDLHDRILHVSDGPPCENEYQTIKTSEVSNRHTRQARKRKADTP